MPWKLHIEKVGDSIALKRTRDNGVTYTAVTYHQISSIGSIFPDGVLNFAPRLADNNRKFTYPYTNKWRIRISFIGDNRAVEEFDTQDVINQAGWTNNQAGFNQALLDINSWLGETEAALEAVAESLTEDVSPDAIDLSAETFPYDFPAETYRSATVVVPAGETIDFNGTTLEEGSYPFDAGSGTLDTFQLTNPSATPTGVVILVTM